VIDRSLMLLARLRFAAWLRGIRRGMSSKRGVAFFIIGVLILLTSLLPSILGRLTRSDLGRAGYDSERVRDVAPLVGLAFTLFMVVRTGNFISFSRAEINFLFPGPFSRRQLVLWKIGMSGVAAIGISLLVAFWQLPTASLWIAAFAGMWLAWMFAQSLAMLVALARQSLTAQPAMLAVRASLIAVLPLLAIGVLDIVRPLSSLLSGDGLSWTEFLAHKNQSLPARVVLAPFDVLACTFTATRVFPDLLAWASASAAMLAVAIWLALRLDEHFIETSLHASENLHAAVQRMKHNDSYPFAAASKPIRSLRLPMLPWLGGCGPVAWRQMMLAVRGARGLLLILLMLVLGLAPLAWVMSPQRMTIIPLPALAAVWLVFLLPSMLRFDFRSDLAHVEHLKTLPIARTAIATGQMLAPALALGVLGGGVIGAIIAIAPEQAMVPGLIALAFLPCVAFLLIGVENAAFLLFPAAHVIGTPGDVTMIGRAMVLAFLKAMAKLVVLGVIAGTGGLTLRVSQSWPVALSAAWMVLLAAALAIVPVVARLFTRFDLSQGTPAE
jgi:hypothetical protein